MLVYSQLNNARDSDKLFLGRVGVSLCEKQGAGTQNVTEEQSSLKEGPETRMREYRVVIKLATSEICFIT